MDRSPGHKVVPLIIDQINDPMSPFSNVRERFFMGAGDDFDVQKFTNITLLTNFRNLISFCILRRSQSQVFWRGHYTIIYYLLFQA